MHSNISRLRSLILAAALIVCSHSRLRAADLEPMVPLFHKWQMEKAAGLVARAAEHSSGRIQFCIALQAELDAAHRVKSIGLYQENRNGPGNAYYPSDKLQRDQFRDFLRPAFAEAARRKLAVSVLLHLNSHGKINEWRNHFDFDPLATGGGSSYEQAVLEPLFEALESSLPAESPVEVSLQGEMGTTVFRYPGSWRTLVTKFRERRKLPNCRLGLSFNYGGVAGRVKPGDEAQQELKKLWEACDFIGVSMYQGVSLPPVARDFDLAMGLFAGEFAGLGCPLPSGKPVHLVEVGIGGGGLSDKDWKTHIPADQPASAARAPYLGSSDAKTADPWASEALRTLRRDYHRALCAWLSQPGRIHRVEKAFLWSFGSWDPQGVENDAFADAEISAMIRAHNAEQGSNGAAGK